LRAGSNIELTIRLIDGRSDELAVAHAMLSLYGYAPPRESIEKARAAALRLNPSAPYALHGDADCLMVDQALDWLDKAADCGSYELTYIVFRPD